MIRIAICIFLTTAACTTGDSNPKPDASGSVDSPTAGAFGAACTTVSDTSTECMSGVCTNSFDQIGHPVCSQRCTVLGGTDTTCPMGSSGQKCNQQGYCRP
jgi:hypothetical protein